MIKLTSPVNPEEVKKLRAGDVVLISGVIYTGRDAAHKRLCELLAKGEELPINVDGSIIYYVGPTPAKPGRAIGSAGPTSSYRMDAYSEPLMQQGLKVMVGKGSRSAEYKKQLQKYGAVYLSAIGGAAASISETIKTAIPQSTAVRISFQITRGRSENRSSSRHRARITVTDHCAPELPPVPISRGM